MNLKQKHGKVPNFFAMLAHKPEVLKTFLPFDQAIIEDAGAEWPDRNLYPVPITVSMYWSSR